MWTAQFWRDALERAIKTGAQTVAGLLVTGATILDIDWTQAVAVTGTAVLASLLTSLVSSGVGDPRSAALLADDGGKYRRGRRVR
ncbi:MAG: holin [Gordonia sp. (in: high G+C Gram-positive bacteria)]|uniref:holin n=1 Tax=Gordonia sp. (in: high G+C Gram-positive bacteria) TaxID=84139 RepID=UPI0039E6E55C